MSIAIMTQVWRMDLPSTDKMVLLALADAANDDGVTWMAVRSRREGKLDIIQKTSLSERAIQNAMKRLEESGHISREMRDGKGTIYTVFPDPRTTCTPAAGAQTPARRAPKPSNNPSTNVEDINTRARASKRCPSDWQPNQSHADLGGSLGMDLRDISAESFAMKDHTFATARKDWDATFRNWLRTAAERKQRYAPRATPKSDHLAGIASAMGAALGGIEGEHRDHPGQPVIPPGSPRLPWTPD